MESIEKLYTDKFYSYEEKEQGKTELMLIAKNR